MGSEVFEKISNRQHSIPTVLKHYPNLEPRWKINIVWGYQGQR